MKHPLLVKNLMFASVATLCAAAVQPALADDDCNVPLTDWKPRTAVEAMAQGRGWNVDKLKTDDGCYEIRGHDASGRKFKARVDPGTLAIVGMRTEGDRHHEKESHERDRDRDETRATPQIAPPARSSPAAAGSQPANAPPGALITPGTKPDVQVR